MSDERFRDCPHCYCEIDTLFEEFEGHTCLEKELQSLERQLAEAEKESKKLKSGVFVIMRSGANADFPVSFKHTKEEAEAEALKLDKQQKYFPHYVEHLKEKG